MSDGKEITIAGDWSKLLIEIYGDALRPGFQNVGRAIGDVLSLAPLLTTPLHLLSERTKSRIQDNLERYRIKLEKTKADDICSVAPEIGVPILQRFTYASDDQISELFANLLASASIQHNAGKAHPSFIHVIDCLTPDEAHILQEFVRNESVPFIDLRTPTHNAWVVHRELITRLKEDVHLTFPSNVPIYLNNLIGMGVLRADRGHEILDESVYQNLEKIGRNLMAKQDGTMLDQPMLPLRGILRLTEYGEAFLDVCQPTKSPP